MKTLLKTSKVLLTTCVVAVVAFLFYQNSILTADVAKLKADNEVLKLGQNQIVINTQNIATLAKIMNPDIDKTLPQAPVEGDVMQPEASTMPAVQNSSATAN